MMITENDKAYMKVISAFRKLIDTDFREGGWLPSVREMSRRFNVCTITYRKATTRLIAEGMAESFPRKGIYIIPKKYRIKKIGIVIGTGEESPLLYGNRVIRDILKSLEKKGFICQMIQGNSTRNIARSAITHYVSGLIWLLPHKPDVQGIKAIHKNILFPLICISFYTPSNKDEAFSDEIPCVFEDYDVMSDKMLEPFIIQGHKKLACLGQTLWRAEYTGLSSRLRESGFIIDDDFCIDGILHNLEKAILLVKEKGVTGLIVNGEARHIKMVFEKLSTLPDEHQPAVLVWNCQELSGICSKYPKINLIGIANHDQQKYGETAVKMLTDNLDTPENIVSMKIKSFNVEHTNKFYGVKINH